MCLPSCRIAEHLLYLWVFESPGCSLKSHRLIDIGIPIINLRRSIPYKTTSDDLFREQKPCSLQLRHNGRHDVSSHRRPDCLLSHLFGRRSKKTSKLRVTGLPSPHEGPVTRKIFPFDDIIMSLQSKTPTELRSLHGIMRVANVMAPNRGTHPPESTVSMMTSSNGNFFRVTGLLCGEFTDLRWIPRTKASDAELWCFLWSAPELTIE